MRSIEQVLHTYRGTAVAQQDDDFFPRVGEAERYARGQGDAAPMKTVYGMRGEVLVQDTYAADVSYDDDIERIDAELLECGIQRARYGVVATPRAEGQGLVHKGFGFRLVHGAAFLQEYREEG